MLLVTSAEATVGPPQGTPAIRPSRAGNEPQTAALTGCEQRLQPGRRPGVPVVVVVGASITAGVGAADPAGSWAVLLARQLHWNAFVYGVPGAGYVHAGLGGKGPVATEIARAHLRLLQPALVIVQAGHDDMSVPPDLERLRAEGCSPSRACGNRHPDASGSMMITWGSAAVPPATMAWSIR